MGGDFRISESARLQALFQEGSAKVRFLKAEDDCSKAVLINTAGGLAGGDAFSWKVDLGPETRRQVVTQACDRVYRSLGQAARVEVNVQLGAKADLEGLPQETILFDGARLARTFDARVGPGGRMLVLEAAVLGRTAMGEVDIRRHVITRAEVMEGVAEVIHDVQVEATFPDGAKLVTVHEPIR